MEQFQVLPCPEEAGLAPSCPAAVARERKREETAPSEAAGSILTRGREGIMKILVYESARIGLKFIGPLLVDGAVLNFDHWFCFRGIRA